MTDSEFLDRCTADNFIRTVNEHRKMLGLTLKDKRVVVLFNPHLGLVNVLCREYEHIKHGTSCDFVVDASVSPTNRSTVSYWHCHNYGASGSEISVDLTIVHPLRSSKSWSQLLEGT